MNECLLVALIRFKSIVGGFHGSGAHDPVYIESSLSVLHTPEAIQIYLCDAERTQEVNYVSHFEQNEKKRGICTSGCCHRISKLQLWEAVASCSLQNPAKRLIRTSATGSTSLRSDTVLRFCLIVSYMQMNPCSKEATIGETAHI